MSNVKVAIVCIIVIVCIVGGVFMLGRVLGRKDCENNVLQNQIQIASSVAENKNYADAIVDSSDTAGVDRLLCEKSCRGSCKWESNLSICVRNIVQQ